MTTALHRKQQGSSVCILQIYGTLVLQDIAWAITAWLLEFVTSALLNPKYAALL